MASSEGLLFGPMLIGIFLNCILYGATVVQIHVYFQTFKRDKPWLKLFVVYLLLCETLNTIFDTGVVYEPLILHYATPQVLTHAPIMIAAHPLMTVLISFPVQLFIAWRIKVLSKSIVFPAIIGVLALISFSCGIGISVSVILIDFQYALFAKNIVVGSTWLASSAAADVIITASLVYTLSRKRTGFAATDDIVDKLIRLTVQTGMITALSALLDIVLYMGIKNTNWFFIPDMMLSKLYTNTLLSSLNARGGWKASSTVRDNVLFGHTDGGESATRSHTQVEIRRAVTADYYAHEHSLAHAVPMKLLDSKAGSGHESDLSSSVKVYPGFEGEA